MDGQWIVNALRFLQGIGRNFPYDAAICKHAALALSAAGEKWGDPWVLNRRVLRWFWKYAGPYFGKDTSESSH
jgi:hypothetical protein